MLGDELVSGGQIQSVVDVGVALPGDVPGGGSEGLSGLVGVIVPLEDADHDESREEGQPDEEDPAIEDQAVEKHCEVEGDFVEVEHAVSMCLIFLWVL